MVSTDMAVISWLPQPESLKLTQILVDFMRATTRNDSQRLVEQFPDLLNDAALALLTDLRNYASICGNEEAEQVIVENRVFLLECRTTGVKAAFARRGAQTSLSL